MAIFDVNKLTAEARKLAVDYREATGKTLPITAEIAINDAIHLLKLKNADKDANGYDALMSYNDEEIKVQIKGRAIFDETKSGHRLGQLKLEQEWDGIVLVVMNDKFESVEIYFCHRDEIESALAESTPNKRGSLTLARFKIIADLVWTTEEGRVDSVWSNQE